MNLIFKYNGNAKYSANDLNFVYTGNNFLALDVYLNEKWPSVKIRLLNIFKDHHVAAKSCPATIGYDKWNRLRYAYTGIAENFFSLYPQVLEECF